jgi:hypothetical protein
VNDRTVRFALKDGFERSERYKVRVVESASSQNGLTLERPFEMRFSAVGYLEVTGTQPAADTEDVPAETVVTVMFNRPVVALTAIENAAGLPDPLTFVPPVKGQGTWLNTSIYQFTPAAGFEPATAYTARVDQGLTDATGAAILADDYQWRFTTVTPAVVASVPAEGDVFVSPSPVISVTFNQPMDRPAVEAAFKLLNNETEEPVPGQFAWVNDGLIPPSSQDEWDYYDYEYDEGAGPEKVGVETLAFTPDTALDLGVGYRLELPAGVNGAGGQAATARDFSAVFTVSPAPAIDSTYPADGDTGIYPWSSLQITFNAPINPDSLVLGKNLIIRPTVAATEVYTYWWSSNTSLEISFPTESSTRYSVRLGADIEGRYGQTLGQSTTIGWETSAQSPMIYLHSPGRMATYNAYTDTLAYVSVRNVNQVDFSLYKLSRDDFMRLNGSNWWDEWDIYQPDQSARLAEWTLPANPELDDTLIYKIDIGKESGLGNPLPPACTICRPPCRTRPSTRRP